jgi:hypothetical protein
MVVSVVVQHAGHGRGNGGTDVTLAVFGHPLQGTGIAGTEDERHLPGAGGNCRVRAAPEGLAVPDRAVGFQALVQPASAVADAETGTPPALSAQPCPACARTDAVS